MKRAKARKSGSNTTISSLIIDSDCPGYTVRLHEKSIWGMNWLQQRIFMQRFRHVAIAGGTKPFV
ncbi:MAG: hypothetical protein JSR90_15955 [Proteobacteria bacterium]|nr:hypothetical protein [Pseudomonadota bacterium]